MLRIAVHWALLSMGPSRWPCWQLSGAPHAAGMQPVRPARRSCFCASWLCWGGRWKPFGCLRSLLVVCRIQSHLSACGLMSGTVDAVMLSGISGPWAYSRQAALPSKAQVDLQVLQALAPPGRQTEVLTGGATARAGGPCRGARKMAPGSQMTGAPCRHRWPA